MNNSPLVSVCMITYNHEKYIKEAIDGVLMQKTTFLIELIISEDCSTDNTRQIISEYAKKYPNIIVADFPIKNRGMTANFYYNIKLARGKYIALCEGDDYWIDPLKLQKQADFLEANEEYSLVYTNYKKYVQKTAIYESSSAKYVQEENVYENILKKNINCMTLTVMFRRNVIYNMNILPQGFFMGDWYLYILASLVGKFKWLSEETGVYRILPNSASHILDTKKARYFLSSVDKTLLYFLEKYPIKNNNENKIIKKKYYFEITYSCLLNRDYVDMKYVKVILYPICPIFRTFITLLCKCRFLFYVISRFIITK